MQENSAHLYKSGTRSTLNLFLYFIPALIFSSVIIFYMLSTGLAPKEYTKTATLGNTTLDKNVNN